MPFVSANATITACLSSAVVWSLSTAADVLALIGGEVAGVVGVVGVMRVMWVVCVVGVGCV